MKSKQAGILATALAAMLMAGSASAHLGESLVECTARYGAPGWTVTNITRANWDAHPDWRTDAGDRVEMFAEWIGLDKVVK